MGEIIFIESLKTSKTEFVNEFQVKKSSQLIIYSCFNLSLNKDYSGM